MSEKTWFADFLQALDGHTAASLAEAEEALSQGFKPFETFMDEVYSPAAFLRQIFYFFMTDFPTLACHNRCKGN